MAANYTIQDINGNLTVTPAALTVKADDKGISDDDNLPVFTSTITGFKNGESNTITCQPLYTVSPVYRKEQPGIYTITPYGLQLKYANNYLISYLTGTLYVNADNCRNVVPKLDCVETLTGDPSGYNYAAHFSYNNPNATTVYIPAGSNNKITVTGGYSGQLPLVFYPGGGQFKIYFNGSKMTWTLDSDNSNYSSGLTATASSSSPKCSTKTLGYSEGSAIDAVSTQETDVAADVSVGSATVYPNPVNDLVTIRVPAGSVSNDHVQVIDAYGRNTGANIIRSDEHSIVMNLGKLSSGVYIIRIKVDGVYKVFRVVKI